MNVKSCLRRVSLAVLCLVLLAPLSVSCYHMPAPVRYVLEYAKNLQAGDYTSCYWMTDPFSHTQIEMNVFIQKHIDIYSAMELTGIEYAVGDPSREGAGYLVPLTLHYQSEIFGMISHPFEVQLTQDDGEWRVRWNPSYLLPNLSWGDSAHTRTLRPKRGDILDKESNAYAMSAYALTVYADLEAIEDVDDFYDRASDLLDMSHEAITERIQRAQQSEQDTVILAAYLPDALPEATEQALLDIPGIKLNADSMTAIRYYPNGPMFAHTVGYTSPIQEDEIYNLDSRYYDSNSRIGRKGLESSYEETLRGERGMELYITNSSGVRTYTVARKEPIDGLDLELTIDFTLQKRAEDLLKVLPEDVRGAIICMDPETGEVSAMASYPTFDPNLFTFSVPTETMAVLQDERSGNPEYSRLTQGTYAPGSIIKPFVAGLALMSEAVSPNWEFKGRIVKRQWTPSDPWPHPPITRVYDYSAPVNMENALVHSDNIYFASLALQMGWTKMEPFFEGIGFTEAIPFDVPVSKPKIYNQPNYDNRRLLADTGYGQGELLITPLQMTALFCAFSNSNGDIPTPYIVSATKKVEGSQYTTVETMEHEAWKTGVLSKEALETIRPMMRKVITRGTGKDANIPGMTIYGKTGTAEIDDAKKREIAWICTSVEEGERKRVVCIMLEVPSGEGDIRYEICKAMMR